MQVHPLLPIRRILPCCSSGFGQSITVALSVTKSGPALRAFLIFDSAGSCGEIEADSAEAIVEDSCAIAARCGPKKETDRKNTIAIRFIVASSSEMLKGVLSVKSC